MNTFPYDESTIAEEEYKKRVKKVKKFSKDFINWFTTSAILVFINFMIAGGLTWAKWPVFIWGIIILSQGVKAYRSYRLNKIYEARRWQYDNRKIEYTGPDYSDELLNPKNRKEKTPVARDGKPWRDEDLV